MPEFQETSRPEVICRHLSLFDQIEASNTNSMISNHDKSRRHFKSMRYKFVKFTQTSTQKIWELRFVALNCSLVDFEYDNRVSAVEQNFVTIRPRWNQCHQTNLFCAECVCHGRKPIFRAKQFLKKTLGVKLMVAPTRDDKPVCQCYQNPCEIQ